MCGPEELVTAAAVLSVTLAQGQSAEYLNYMGALLMMVGQNLTTMAEAKAYSQSCCQGPPETTLNNTG